ncbi:MAG: hypothetical protein SXQ77_02230, partial [Halobacteria archaeon]|nr:hypothetical protein [Halobacteria archaeon]
MDGVERRELEADLSPVEAYVALDADVLLERRKRGWKETYVAAAWQPHDERRAAEGGLLDVDVAAEPVDEFRYSRDEDSGLERLRDWLASSLLDGTDMDTDTDTDTDAGAFGYIGYDVAKEIEDVTEDTVRDFDLPDITVEGPGLGVSVDRDRLAD